MQSTNPVLTRSDTFSRRGYATFRNSPDLSAPSGVGNYAPTAPSSSRPMTIDDVVSRTGLLLIIVVTAGTLSWVADIGYGLAVVAALVGFGLAMVNSFKRVPSPPLIMLYALFEGVFLGAFSHALEESNPKLDGVALQAVAGTAIVFAVMLALYRSGKVRVTAKSQRIVFGALIAFVGLQMFNMILWMFGAGVNTWGGSLGIGIGALGVGLGAYMLAMDFDLVEQGVRNGAPEVEAWRAAFGLTVTIVWLYIEMLRLLSSLRQN